MYLLSGLLLTTLIAFCQSQDQLPPQCQGQDGGTCYSKISCSNISDMSSLTDSFSSGNVTIFILKITDSPQLQLHWENLNLIAFPQLKYLWLLDNNFTSFNSEWFKAQHLESFELRGNNLVSINASTFQGITTVTELVLSNNQITTIHNGAFKHFQNLSELDLSDNKLTTIDANLFQDLALSLTELNVANNLLTFIGERSFHGLAELLHVDLSNNRIKTIDPKAFQTLPKLQEIELKGNELQRLDSGLFENTNIQYIELSYNDLEIITNYPLNSPTLEALSLVNCNIHKIPPKYFDNLPNLKVLYLEENEISDIDDNLFTHLVQLRDLNLSRNNFTSLSVISFQQFYNIISRSSPMSQDVIPFTTKEVKFHSNPWECGLKDMMNLRAWALEHNVDFDKVFGICKV